MTTWAEVTRLCAVCGHESQHTVVTSTTAFGSPDLDLRPPELARRLVALAVQECPACGYCAADITLAPAGTPATVASDEYQQLRHDRSCPQEASWFLCAAFVAERSRQFAVGGREALNAAWVCDDAGAMEAAQRCRARAVELFERARARGQRFAGRRGDEDLLLVDLLRRAGRAEEAEQLVRAGLARERRRTANAVLRFQLMLLAEADTQAYPLAMASIVGPCGTVPEFLREFWPSRREPVEAWPDDPARFLDVAARHSSLAALWQGLPRAAWLLWLYGRAGVAHNARALGRFWGWCLRRAVEAMPRETPGTPELSEMVAKAEGRLTGEASPAEWNEALIWHVRRRPADERSQDEAQIFWTCRRTGDRPEGAARVAAARDASAIALAILGRPGRKRQDEAAVQAQKIREVLANPFPDPDR